MSSRLSFISLGISALLMLSVLTIITMTTTTVVFAQTNENASEVGFCSTENNVRGSGTVHNPSEACGSYRFNLVSEAGNNEQAPCLAEPKTSQEPHHELTDVGVVGFMCGEMPNKYYNPND
jgi:hypothetical protein